MGNILDTDRKYAGLEEYEFNSGLSHGFSKDGSIAGEYSGDRGVGPELREGLCFPCSGLILNHVTFSLSINLIVRHSMQPEDILDRFAASTTSPNSDLRHISNNWPKLHVLYLFMISGN
jgi:hypothetical protein